MSLNQKVALIVVLIFTLSGAASLIVQQTLVMPSFVSLERDTAEKNVERVLQGIGREIALIRPVLGDWAAWTDTYEYMVGEFPEYLESNLEFDDTLSTLELNYLGFFSRDGSAVWKRAWDLDADEQIDVGLLTGEQLPVSHPLMEGPLSGTEVSGLVQTQQAPLLVMSQPILRNDFSGPPAGVLIMGRFLDQTAVARLAEQTRLAVTVEAPTTLTTAERAMQSADLSLQTGELLHGPLTLLESATQWRGKSVLGDVFGNPILTVDVNTPRNISARGRSAVNTAMLSLLATGLFTMLALWFALHRVVLRPLKVVADHAQRVGQSDDLHSKLDLERHDEIGVLARNFDHMVDNLAQARRKIVDQSYRSGIAEMASGVLHNIGNAITPLIVKLETLGSEFRKAPTSEVRQAVGELANPATPEARRADLSRFVELAGAELAELCERGLDDVTRATTQVGNIREILSDQERLSRSARVVEPVDIGGLINDAATTLIDGGHDSLQIEIDASVKTSGPVAGARAALQQVLTNLLINAAEAVEETGRPDGHVRVSARTETCDGRSCIVHRFADNGVGIDPAVRASVFQRGFSTKQRDGSGYGLHWSANTLQALGGELRLIDTGAEPGASFEMWLPAANLGRISANDALAGTVDAPATGTGG